MRTFLLLINLLVCFVATSQTTLERGDIMVLGVNGDTNCSPYPSNLNTAIYLVAFKNITPNTIIDLTDNGYYRVNANRFGTTEGALRFVRKTTASTITAGTVFTLLLSVAPAPNNSSNQTIYINRLNSHNSEWNVSLLNNSTSDSTIELNFSTASDQLFLLQGNPSPNPWNRIGNQNASYSGRFLYGFNSKRNWRREPSSNASQESALPGYDINDSDLALYNLRRHHFSPHAGGFSRSYYSGPTSQTSKNEWLIRILNSRNWTSFSDCNTFANYYNLSTTLKPGNPLQIVEKLGTEAVCKDDVLDISIDYETPTSTNTIQAQYEWFERDTPGNNPGTSLGITTRQLTVPTGTEGIKYYYCMITYKLSWTNSGPGSSATEDESFNTVASGYYEVTVNPNPITSPVIPL